MVKAPKIPPFILQREFVLIVIVCMLAGSYLLFPYEAIAVNTEKDLFQSSLKQDKETALHTPLTQPIIFVHGLEQDASIIGNPQKASSKNTFVPLYDELQRDYTPVKTFWYVDDQGYAKKENGQTTYCPPEYSPCQSESAVLDNALKLAREISDLYSTFHHKVALIGYSMGAAIIRTTLAGCQQQGICQASLGQNIAAMVNDVFFIEGVQQGSWLAKIPNFALNVAGAGANALADVIPSLKAHIGLLEPSPAKRDLKPQSENITSRNGVLPPNNIHYFNFYGDIQFSSKSCIMTVFCKTNAAVSIGDAVIFPGTDDPTGSPTWGGARFCLRCDGNNFSQIDANTTYEQWSLSKSITIDYQDAVLCSLPTICKVKDLSELLSLSIAPQMHIHIPSDASLNGTAIQVKDTTGMNGSPTTSIAHEIALQLEAMPATDTSCPAQGTARPAVMVPLASAENHQNIVYIENEGTSDAPNSSSLERYDVTTKQTADIIKLPQTWISSAQISADGQWVIFVSEVNGSSEIQMVRVDGQGLQTLYCMPSPQYFSPPNILLSPDQKQLVVSTMPEGTFYLINMTNGAVQTMLQPVAQNSTFYEPVMWLNNTQLYLWRYPIMYSALFLMNTQNGPKSARERTHRCWRFPIVRVL